MAEKHVDVALPEEVLTSFGWQDTEVPYRVLELAVMELLRSAQLSEAQAAALLHLDRWDLLERMGRYRVPAMRMSQEELQQELAQTFPSGGPV